MNNFTFHTPTEIVFGRGSESEVARLVKKYGGRRVLMVYGGGSAVRSGLIGRVAGLLAGAGLTCLEYGGVKPNPVLSHVRSGAEAAVGFGADFVLAVGGGSSIDEAKAIAHGTANPGIDLWKFWTREAEFEKSLPIGVILTISAAGSETSEYSVITNDANGEKRGFQHELNRPKFAIMDPALTLSVPKFQLACGTVDILMHTLERWFSDGGYGGVTDALAAAVMRCAIKYGSALVNNPDDYHAAAQLMWCGSLSHNGLTGLGRPRDFSAHALGQELGGRFDCAHGATLSAMWGSWARHCLGAGPARFAQYARDVWGVINPDDNAAATEGIERTEAFFRSIGMPTCFTELGIGVQPPQVIAELADSCVFYGKRLVGVFYPLGRDDVTAVYNMANR